MSNETETAKNINKKEEDERPFSEKHPNVVKAAKTVGHYMAITAVMVVSTFIVLELYKRYGHIKGDGTVSNMDQF